MIDIKDYLNFPCFLTSIKMIMCLKLTYELFKEPQQ